MREKKGSSLCQLQFSFLRCRREKEEEAEEKKRVSEKIKGLQYPSRGVRTVRSQRSESIDYPLIVFSPQRTYVGRSCINGSSKALIHGCSESFDYQARPFGLH